MDNLSVEKCELFSYNYQEIKNQFFDNQSIIPALGALMCTAKGIKLERDNLIEEKTSFGNTFSKDLIPFLISACDYNDLGSIGMLHGKMKNSFIDSPYLTVAAYILNLYKNEDVNIDTAINKLKSVHDSIFRKHPILTGNEDIPVLVDFAVSNKNEEEITKHIEESYEVLKENHFFKNSMQSLGFIMSLSEDPKAVNEKMASISEAFKKNSFTVGTDYHVVALGVLAQMNIDNDEIVCTVSEINDYLKLIDGFKPLMITKKDRHLFAMLLLAICSAKNDYQIKVVKSAILMVLTSVMSSSRID